MIRTIAVEDAAQFSLGSHSGALIVSKRQQSENIDIKTGIKLVK